MSRSHSQSADQKAISHHYDLSNEFYQLFLDENMVYSCAYFRSGEDLDQAQKDKLDHICRKLRLKPGERLLDIGCGWGGLIAWAARHYGVYAHGVTISENQYEYANSWIRREGFLDQCKVDLMDYRDLEGNYDKIVSVGMFEHVGLKNLPVYFGTAQRLLKEKGLFLNHGITVSKGRKKSTPEARFIDQYIFPGGELDNISNILHRMELASFEVLDVESLRPHYAMTLKHWARRLEAQKEEAIRTVGERKYRAWLLYLAGCAFAFQRGDISVYQVLLSRQTQGGFSKTPLTREDIYTK